jgi:uncharacterized protein (TIGR00251 family)
MTDSLQPLIGHGAEGIYLMVHARPGARHRGVVGIHGDALKVAVSASPVGGRANQAVVELLAETLGVNTGDVEVVGGHTSRRKRVLVRGLSVEQAIRRLSAVLHPEGR